MEQKIIDGKALAETLKDEVKTKISGLKEDIKKVPSLAVIIVGNDPASVVYVRNKEKACKKCGIKSLKYEFRENVEEGELLNLINELNQDDNVNGILVQLPLPKRINYKNIIKAISPKKDVDCFHLLNAGSVFVGDFNFDTSLLPCTPKGCVKLIKMVAGEKLDGKRVCIVGRSNIVGKPLAQLLLNENCTVKITHSRTENINDECLWADILVAAVGKPKFITADMVKNGAIVIDVGINRVGDKLCGDVDFENVVKKVGYITPVPGGVGPMTIACLMENVYNAFLEQNSL